MVGDIMHLLGDAQLGRVELGIQDLFYLVSWPRHVSPSGLTIALSRWMGV